MPYFTDQRRASSSKAVSDDFEFEISVLVLAKKVGLTFSEINEMKMNDFIKFLDMWTDEQSTKDADQEDIDYFYANM